MSVLIWNKWFSNNSFKLLFIKNIKGLLIAMFFFFCRNVVELDNADGCLLFTLLREQYPKLNLVL